MLLLLIFDLSPVTSPSEADHVDLGDESGLVISLESQFVELTIGDSIRSNSTGAIWH